MGLPGFFAWLLKKYKENKDHKMIFNNLPDRPKRLYIDANCAFHPQCFKLLHFYEEEKISNETLESKMIDRIINYIDFLISYVNPEELVYISVDGVAPLAKIKQQRMRRFRSVEDNQIKLNLKKKYNLPVSPNQWTNTVITPGTEFMEKLHTRILNYMKNKKNIIYSSYHTAGEGEHKILQHIKKSKNKDDIYVIYGLDADLFFLSIASNKNNLYLLREASQFEKEENKSILDPIKDVKEPLKYVSVDITKNMYCEQMINIIKNKLEHVNYDVDILKIFDKKRFCDDFVLICFLLGNDFLPHLPSIDIKKGGLDIILDCYADTFLTNGTHIITDNKIDNVMFIDLITNIGTKEHNYFTYILPRNLERNTKKNIVEPDPYKKELWEIENLKNIITEDPIKLGKDSEEEWKFRYYNHYFNISEHYYKGIGDICYNYLVGIKWVFNYYFKECIDYSWQYPYLHGAFVSDISSYYYDTALDLNKIKFNSREPFSPCAQLLAVLPPQCSNLLPISYRHLVSDITSPILDLFPMKVNIDTIYKEQLWQCIPYVPIVDSSRINNSIKNYKLSKEEEIRNKILNEIIC
jgi:5'-3' exonuclease